jgi:hypothetical protein
MRFLLIIAIVLITLGAFEFPQSGAVKLLQLAPDLQEQILFLLPVKGPNERNL